MLFLHPANCGDPSVPRNGSIEAYQNTNEGTEIFFRCGPGYIPAGRTRAVCAADGMWNPDPATACTCKSTHSLEKEYRCSYCLVSIRGGGSLSVKFRIILPPLYALCVYYVGIERQ